MTLLSNVAGAERSAVSDSNGAFDFQALLPGTYTISVEATGFKKFQKTHNKLDPNIAATVDLNLEVGAVTETVEVTASATMIQSETATLGKIVTAKELETLQLNGRNPIFLALLLFAFSGPAAALDVGDKAPDFDLPSTKDGKFKLSNMAGKKNVIIQFYVLDFTPT